MNLFKEIDKLQIQINNIRPLSEFQTKELRQYYKIGLTYTSNAIEGNSLTESETKIILEDGITIGGKLLKHHLEAKGHSKAYLFMYKLIKNNQITENNIKKLHKLFYELIEPDKAGIYRTEQVFISGSKYKPTKPENIQEQMTLFVNKYKTNKNSLHTVELAAKIHKDFVFIHPFIDGNGRVARLLTNLIFIKASFPIVIIPPILRAEYIAFLEKAHINDIDFIKFIAERVKQAQLEFIRLME